MELKPWSKRENKYTHTKHSKVISFQYMYKGKEDKIYHLFLKIGIISHNEILGINLTFWSS